MSGQASDSSVLSAPFQWLGIYPNQPNAQAPPGPPNPATQSQTAAGIQAAEMNQQTARGRAATILTGANGLDDSPSTKASTLLGS